MELIERIPLNRIEYLDSLPFDTISSFYKCKDKTELKTQYEILKHFCKVNIKDRGQTTRLYSYSLSTPLGNGGRLYSGNSIQGLNSTVRGFLMDGITTDIDMKNAHPTILKYICLKHNILCPYLTEYVEKRDTVLNNFDGYTKDEAKTLFLCAMNDNKTKRLKNGIKNSFFKSFDKEMKHLQITISSLECYADIKSSVPSDKKFNWNGSALNRVLCMFENQILQACISVLNRKDIEIATLMFDGLMCYGDFYSDNNLLMQITEGINNKFENLNMVWDYKPHKKDIIMNDDFVVTVPDTEYISFNDTRTEFELTHCKIINKSFFVKEMTDNIFIMNRQQLSTSYEHLAYQKKDLDGNVLGDYNFINDWLKFPLMRCKEDIGVYPDASKCPSNHFNSWKPFAMELITKYEPDEKAVEFFKKHILILCGNDKLIAEYFEKWIAQMIQFPAVKSICPVLISKEGAGKGSLMQLLGNMMGQSKIFETSNPARDVWGDFNGRMATTFFVNLNELSKKETAESEGKIKALITDPKITINNKGVSQYDINSFHRFLITTNNLDPVKTTTDDRRKIIIRSSDELIGDKDYFNKLYELLGNENAVKSCFEYFKSIPNMEQFNKLEMPNTEFHTNMKEANVSLEEQWVKSFIIDNITEVEVQLTSSDVYCLFNDWLVLNGFKDYKTNSLKLNLKLSNMNIEGLVKGKHTNKGNTKLFIIATMKTHFNIGCLLNIGSTVEP